MNQTPNQVNNSQDNQPNFDSYKIEVDDILKQIKIDRLYREAKDYRANMIIHQDPHNTINLARQESSSSSQDDGDSLSLINCKKNIRKIRTTITRERLLEMNKLFTEYTLNKQTGVSSQLTFKEIGKALGLGYSTILHKYREFRSTQKVKGGTLINSLQKKRKYQKSMMIQRIIEQSLNEKTFYTANELSKYIQEKFGLIFSRSIISRHLGEMGYSYKNMKRNIEEKKYYKYQQTRKIYAEIILPLLEREQKLIYIDELTCSVGPQTQGGEPRYVSIIVMSTIYGILFYNIQEGFFTRQLFYQVLQLFLVNLRESQSCRLLQGSRDEIYLVMDMNHIHRDNIENKPGISSLILQQNAQMLYIPPCSPQFNPNQGIFSLIKQKLKSNTIHNFDELWTAVDNILQLIKVQPTHQYFEQVSNQLLRCHKQQII